MVVDYQEFNEGTCEVDEISGEEGIGQEPSNKGKQESGAHEICHRIRWIWWWEVHVFREIQSQVACIRQICKIPQHPSHYKKKKKKGKKVVHNQHKRH